MSTPAGDTPTAVRSAPERAAARPNRIHLLDELRGLAVAVMLAYHFLYSLRNVYGIALPFWILRVMPVIQPPFAGLFIAIAGISSCYARSNYRRGVRILLIALLVTLATAMLMPAQAIYFGVLHFYAVSILLFQALRKWLERIPATALAIGSSLLFLVFWPLRTGYLNLPFLGRLHLPSGLYGSVLLAPLGLPPPTFVSADYFPLLPWFLLFLAGTAAGRLLRTSRRLPAFVFEPHAPALSTLGRHSLLIYVIHQPAILALIWLATRLG